MFDGIREYFFLRRIAKKFKKAIRKKYTRKLTKYNLDLVKMTYKNIARRYSISTKQLYYSLPLKVIVADLDGAYGLCSTYHETYGFFKKKKRMASTITLNKTDVTTTTFIHEFGHFIRFLIGQMAFLKNKMAYKDFILITDLVRSRADVAMNGNDNSFFVKGGFSVDEEENFAKTWEMYMRDGQAPSKKLQGIFTHFKTAIFNDMHNRSSKNNYEFFEDLEVKVTPERRKFLDSLLIGKRFKKRSIISTMLEWYIYGMVAFVIFKYLTKILNL